MEENGFNGCSGILLEEKNPLFESLVGKYAIIHELSVYDENITFYRKNYRV